MLENEMDFENRIIAPEYASMEDAEVETSLRPKTLGEYAWADPKRSGKRAQGTPVFSVYNDAGAPIPDFGGGKDCKPHADRRDSERKKNRNGGVVCAR